MKIGTFKKLAFIFSLSCTSSTVLAGSCGGVTHPNVVPHYTNYGLLGQFRAVCRLETQRVNYESPMTEDLTLSRDVLWVLRDYVQVGEPQIERDMYLSPITSPTNFSSATLTIEPGTIVVGDGRDDSAATVEEVPHQNVNFRSDGIVVARGSQIIANGTEDAPIVFTSIQELIGEQVVPGQWGGIAIQGYSYASSNGSSCSFPNCEFNDPLAMQTFAGGVNPEISSGSLNYVLIRYAGKGTPLPGPFFHSSLLLSYVGDTTTIGPVHIHESWDGDGFNSPTYPNAIFKNDNFASLDVSSVIVSNDCEESSHDNDWLDFGDGCFAVPTLGIIPFAPFAGIIGAIAVARIRSNKSLELTV